MNPFHVGIPTFWATDFRLLSPIRFRPSKGKVPSPVGVVPEPGAGAGFQAVHHRLPVAHGGLVKPAGQRTDTVTRGSLDHSLPSQEIHRKANTAGVDRTLGGDQSSSSDADT